MYGVRAGLVVGGAIAAGSAVTIGLVLTRVGDLRLTGGRHDGHPQVRFVPGQRREELATAV